jgi:hypothetical protein
MILGGYGLCQRLFPAAASVPIGPCFEMSMMFGAILAVYGEIKPGMINDPILTC